MRTTTPTPRRVGTAKRREAERIARLAIDSLDHDALAVVMRVIELLAARSRKRRRSD